MTKRWVLSMALLVLGAMVVGVYAETTNEWYVKGFDLVKEGDYFTASVALSQATYQDPENAKAWYLYGVVLNALGKFPEAKTALNKGMELDPEHGNPWFWNTGIPGPLGTKDDAISILKTKKLGELVF